MTIRLIQVGMGGWGLNWATKVVPYSTDVELVACVDMEAGVLVQAQRLLIVSPKRCFPTLELALEAVEADAVLITATLPAHVLLALEAFNAGKHVLLEKPFAPTVAEAQQVVEAAAKRNRVLMISQNYRFLPAIRAVTPLVRKGNLVSTVVASVDLARCTHAAQHEGAR